MTVTFKLSGGCLMAHLQISRALRLRGADGRNAELTIRKLLYGEVVEKLETALAESTPRAGKETPAVRVSGTGLSDEALSRHQRRATRIFYRCV